MKVSQIRIKNYRLLKDFTIDLEDNLSLIIGKNNCGKTSFLSLLERFLAAPEGGSTFAFDDFNLDYQQEIKKRVEENVEIVNEKEKKVFQLGISLDLHIEYNDKDDLTNISLLMLNLDPNIKKVILRFEYTLYAKEFNLLLKHYANYKKEYLDNPKKNAITFLQSQHKNYFNISIKAVEPNNEVNTITLEKKDIKKIINLQCIHAKRDVNNEPGSNKINNKTLSKASSEYYEVISSNSKENPEAEDKTKELKKQLDETDDKLIDIYDTLFNEVIETIKTFGGFKQNESTIKILSNLQEKNILKNSTSVVYDHEGFPLPEDYNGLGYMNLINIIFKLEVLFMNFKTNDTSADINLIFIEEPEAHTHPQMQYVFIEKITDIINKRKIEKEINLQTIVSTHSPHIVTKSNFDDIKYFCLNDRKDYRIYTGYSYKERVKFLDKVKTNDSLSLKFSKVGKTIISKNLKALKAKYASDEDGFRFLKQYLTLHKAELFFADKAIFIEGDTERILLPAMMKKIDNQYPKNINWHIYKLQISNIVKQIKKDNFQVRLAKRENNYFYDSYLYNLQTPLLSQHISIVEAGAYAHIFEKFIEFLGIKVLIITDLDSGKEDRKKCEVNDKDACISTNSAISDFLKTNDLKKLISLSKQEKTILNGKIQLAFQTKENNYHARSFEDAFIHLNHKFIEDNKNLFKGLKNRTEFIKGESPYNLAKHCISNDNKSAFALDILYFGGENFEKWQIPSYIKQGLLWLRQ